MSILYLNSEGAINSLDTNETGIVYKTSDSIIVKQVKEVREYDLTSFNQSISLDQGKYILHFNISAINTDICFMDSFQTLAEYLTDPYYIQTTINGKMIDKTLIIDPSCSSVKYNFTAFSESSTSARVMFTTNYDNLENISIKVIVESL